MRSNVGVAFTTGAADEAWLDIGAPEIVGPAPRTMPWLHEADRNLIFVGRLQSESRVAICGLA